VLFEIDKRVNNRPLKILVSHIRSRIYFSLFSLIASYASLKITLLFTRFTYKININWPQSRNAFIDQSR
jgi:hypothetical protein